jgi:hypothetical protein
MKFTSSSRNPLKLPVINLNLEIFSFSFNYGLWFSFRIHLLSRNRRKYARVYNQKNNFIPLYDVDLLQITKKLLCGRNSVKQKTRIFSRSDLKRKLSLSIFSFKKKTLLGELSNLYFEKNKPTLNKDNFESSSHEFKSGNSYYPGKNTFPRLKLKKIQDNQVLVDFPFKQGRFQKGKQNFEIQSIKNKVSFTSRDKYYETYHQSGKTGNTLIQSQKNDETFYECYDKLDNNMTNETFSDNGFNGTCFQNGIEIKNQFDFHMIDSSEKKTTIGSNGTSFNGQTTTSFSSKLSNSKNNEGISQIYSVKNCEKTASKNTNSQFIEKTVHTDEPSKVSLKNYENLSLIAKSFKSSICKINSNEQESATIISKLSKFYFDSGNISNNLDDEINSDIGLKLNETNFLKKYHSDPMLVKFKGKNSQISNFFSAPNLFFNSFSYFNNQNYTVEKITSFSNLDLRANLDSNLNNIEENKILNFPSGIDSKLARKKKTNNIIEIEKHSSFEHLKSYTSKSLKKSSLSIISLKERPIEIDKKAKLKPRRKINLARKLLKFKKVIKTRSKLKEKVKSKFLDEQLESEKKSNSLGVKKSSKSIILRVINKREKKVKANQQTKATVSESKSFSYQSLYSHSPQENLIEDLANNSIKNQSKTNTLFSISNSMCDLIEFPFDISYKLQEHKKPSKITSSDSIRNELMKLLDKNPVSETLVNKNISSNAHSFITTSNVGSQSIDQYNTKRLKEITNEIKAKSEKLKEIDSFSTTSKFLPLRFNCFTGNLCLTRAFTFSYFSLPKQYKNIAKTPQKHGFKSI